MAEKLSEAILKVKIKFSSVKKLIKYEAILEEVSSLQHLIFNIEKVNKRLETWIIDLEWKMHQKISNIKLPECFKIIIQAVILPLKITEFRINFGSFNRKSELFWNAQINFLSL